MQASGIACHGVGVVKCCEMYSYIWICFSRGNTSIIAASNPTEVAP